MQIVDKTRIGVYAGWERYSNNPVLPFDIGETFDATVLKYKDRYRMVLWLENGAIDCNG